MPPNNRVKYARNVCPTSRERGRNSEAADVKLNKCIKAACSAIATIFVALAIIWPLSLVAEQLSPKEQVFAVERAFAQTMANRDLKAFSEFLSEEAIFFTGTKEPLRGKQQVMLAWASYFKDSNAPFSWEPDQVEVLTSGKLALSTGPVRDATGKIIVRFNSIWRLENSNKGQNKWRIVFDKGSPLSPDPH
jgi:ketosteroid isomerase-like protein